MASTASAVAGAVVENAGADKLIFKDKKTDILQTEKSSDSSDSSKGGSTGDTPITPKDFYWDQILFYLVSAILGLSFLDISVEFFRGSIIQCYIANTAATRDQVAYFNNYCYGSLPNSQYYLIFILISALIIIAPHYLWTSYFGAYFDFFFDLAKKLHRLRDTNTGEYSPYNFELVKKLEQKFSSSNPWMFRWYKLKLLAQLGVCIIVQAVNAFYFDAEDFDESFPCPTDTSLLNTTVWPLPEQLTCVYNSLTLLYFLRNTALGLVTAAIVVCIIGLVWCYARHTTELGAKDIAAFCDVSCLPPEEYPFPSTRKVLYRILYCGKKERLLERYQPKSSSDEQDNVSRIPIERSEQTDARREDDEEKPLCCPCFNGFLSGLKQAITPRIHTDLDFLVTRLFYADSGHGQVFKDIQIQKELNEKISQDHELLYLLNSVHSHLLKKRIKMKLAYRKRGKTMPEDKEWERLKDLKKYFFDSKFGGTNPEEKVYSFFKKDLGVKSTDWTHSPLRSVLFGFLKFAPNNRLALDVSFGNRTGHSLILARAFYHSVTIHFNKYYKNPKKVCQEDAYQANFRTFTYQEDIFSQKARNITESEKLILDLMNEDIDGRKIDLIVIGPMTDRSKIVTTNLLIEKIYGRNVYFREGAILLAMRPLMIGSKSCTGRFIQYQPPEGIFDDIGDEVNNYLVECNVPVYSVSPGGAIKKINEHPTQFYRRQVSNASTLRRRGTVSRLMNRKDDEVLPCGLAIECNNVQCLYEFRVFRFKSQEEDPLSILHEESEPSNDIKDNETVFSSGVTTSREDMTSGDFLPEDESNDDDEARDVVATSGGPAVPIAKLVSPIQSPTSMPNLTLPIQQGPASSDITSKSQPNLL